MGDLASYLAAALYLLPVFVVGLARAERGRPLALVALDVPVALALDYLLTLALCLVLPLEAATFASRGLWLAGLAARLVRGPRPTLPGTFGQKAGLTAFAGTATAVWLSVLISRPYSIWDRKWHTPLVSSLRGQTLPFVNVWNPAETLHYHFSGDVGAAMVQSLSGGTLHSSLALSIHHDILFGLIGLTIALLLVAHGRRGPLVAAVVTALVLLNGPLTLGRDPASAHVEGYSVLNFVTMSFRPHDAVAGLFYVGFLGAVLTRVGRPRAPLGQTAVPLVLSTAGLAISDEASIAILGLSLGVAWLVAPEVVHAERRSGAFVFVLLLLGLVVPNLLFSAALAPGGPAQKLELVSFRSPGCYMPTLPLTDPEGRRMLFYDLGPTALAVGGLLFAAFGRGRRALGPAVLVTTALLTSALLLTRLEVNDEPLESHRFVTGILFTAPLVAALFLGARGAGLGDGLDAARPSPLHRALPLLGFALFLGGAGLGAASSWDWMTELAPKKAHKHTHYFTNEDLYALDCPAAFGATRLERAAPRYLPKAIFYAYAGCRPVLAPAVKANRWDLTIGNPYFDKAALKELDGRFVKAGEALGVVCERGARRRFDPICAALPPETACVPAGLRAELCTVDAAVRARLLGR